jgi:cytochrome c oxidase subunit 2
MANQIERAIKKQIRQSTLFLILTLAASICLSASNEVVDDRYCTTCHGSDGRGNEAIQAPILAGMEDWYLVRQLENYRGNIRGSHPSDERGIAMQAMAKNLSDESISDLVQWIKTWEYSPPDITVTGDKNEGEKLYASCAACHGKNADGNEALGAPPLAYQNDWYLVTQLKNFLNGYRGTHERDTLGQQMVAMAQPLEDDTGIRNVVAYITSLRSK